MVEYTNEQIEDLLEIANIQYPSGTKYFSIASNHGDNRECTRKDKLRFFPIASSGLGTNLITDGNGGAVWENGLWARKNLSRELEEAFKIINSI